jgi:LacI family transcriptional regulator
MGLTLEDVARKCGVSRSTVSRVVNGHPSVSPKVRERVLGVIRTTGYQPNAAARALASRRSWTIGLLLPHSVSFLFTDPYYSHLTKGIAQTCNQSGYTLALFLVAAKEDEQRIFPRLSRQGLLDGVLVQSGHHGDQEIIGRLVDAGMPLVVIGRPFHSGQVSYVDVDNVKGAYRAVGHLVELGYQRIATISGPAISTVGIDRMKGYRKALLDRGRDVTISLISEGDFTEAGGYEAMRRLIPAKPDAVFVASDVMALGAIRAAREAGLSIPADIAFIGFDDLPLASSADVDLTTVHQPVAELGTKAVELLLDRIENEPAPPRHIIMQTKLMIRGTCGVSRRSPVR